MANIVLVTHWTGGDVFPFIKLGHEFKKKGHQVTVLTHCYYEEAVKMHNLTFCPLDTMDFYQSMNKELYKLADPIHHLQDSIDFQIKYQGSKQLIKEYEKISHYCTSKDTIILARHRSSISALLTAEKLKLPYASVVLAPNYFAHMDLHEQLFGNVLKKEINRARSYLGLEPLSSWKNWLYSPKNIWGIWPEWFASQEECWPQQVKCTGFLPVDVQKASFEEKLEKFLNTPGKKVVITGGSSQMVSPLFYKTAVEALQKAGCKGILINRYPSLVPRNLGCNILHVEKTNLAALMHRVDLVIHHGGMGTLNEAVEAGLPQIILPHLTDGPDNAGRLAKLKIARTFPIARWNTEEIAGAIKDLMINEEIQAQCEYYRQMNKMITKEERWHQFLGEIEPYNWDNQIQGVEQVRENEKTVAKELSKKQLIEILKRKRKMN